MAAVMSFAVLAGGQAALAAGKADPLPSIDWSFDGPFGTVDRASAQRGLQIYLENCSGCHSLELLAYRNLTDLGFTEEEVKVIAGNYFVMDGPDDFGEMFERPAIPSDRFVNPYANDQMARAFNNGALPPDLSLMIKARLDGADYVYGLMTGYVDPPDDFDLTVGLHYNRFYPGYQIAMPQVVYEDGVLYSDGTPATIEQQAKDVVNFLQWAGEPHMETSKQLGVKVLVYILAFAFVMWLYKRKVWSDLK